MSDELSKCAVCGVTIPESQLICGMCPACYKRWLQQKQNERER